MSALVAIDPGYAKQGPGCAIALFEKRTLVRAFFARPESLSPKDLLVVNCGEVVWEEPQVDKRTYGATPEVVHLAAVGGTLAGMFAGRNGCRALPVTPKQWKKSLRKPQAHSRLWKAIFPSERALLGGYATEVAIDVAKVKGALDRWIKPGGSYYRASWRMHNLLDAVGIGLWRLDR